MTMRTSSRWRGAAGLLAPLVLLVAGCEKPVITAPLTLAEISDEEGNTTPGKTVPAALLEEGRLVYIQYCRACHGDHGDGRGPAAKGLRPPPRDFRTGSFKFGAVPAGELPSDDDLKRIIRGGLRGTAMLPWRLSDAELEAVVQYLKTFRRLDESGKPTSSRFQEEPPGTALVIPPDPYAPASSAEVEALRRWRLDPRYQPSPTEEALIAKERGALERGRKIYHSLAQCASCHPSYETRTEIGAYAKEITSRCLTEASFRGYAEEAAKNDPLAMYFPDPKGGDYRYPADPRDEEALRRYGTQRFRQALAEKPPATDEARAELLAAVLGELLGDIDATLAAARPVSGPSSGATSQAAESQAASDSAPASAPVAPLAAAELRKLPRATRDEEQRLGEVLRDALEDRNSYFLLPPDFTLHTLRTMRTEDPRLAYVDLYRVIASGIGGTAMPPWKDALPDEDLWAMVHYVYALVEMQLHPESPALSALQARLREQGPYQAPAACNEPASAPVEE